MDFFLKYSRYVLLGVLITLPILGIGAARAVKSNNNQVEDWLPSNFKETLDLSWFRQHFASDQFVIISWDGCCLGDPNGTGFDAEDDPRIEALARALVPDVTDSGKSAPNGVETQDGEGLFPAAYTKSEPEPVYFSSVTTGRRVLDALMKAPSSISREDAIRRLKGALVGPDGRQTCVVVTLTPEATKNLRGSIGRGTTRRFLRFERLPGILWDKVRACHIDPETVRVGGPPVDNVAIDEEGEKTLMRLAGLSMLLGWTLAWLSLRSFRLTAIVFACGIISAMLAMALVNFSGQKMDAILMSMPLLVYVLAMSAAVHLVSYYTSELPKGDLDRAAMRAVRHAWKPALLCSVTTAIGLISLYASELAPIRKFGLYSAMGVIGLLAVTFIFLPAALQLFHPRPASVNLLPPEPGPNSPSNSAGDPRRRRKRSDKSKALASAAVVPPRKPKRPFAERLWSGCALFLIRNSTIVATSSIAIVLLTGAGAIKLHTSIDLLKLFEPHARILKDYTWFEQHLGPLVPLEIVVRFPDAEQQETNSPAATLEFEGIALSGPDDLNPPLASDNGVNTPETLSFLERAELVALCQDMIDRRHGVSGEELVGKSMSPVTFTAPLPAGKNDAVTIAQRSTTSDLLWNHRSGFISSGFLRVNPDDQAELWRISLRVKAFAGVDFGSFLEETRATLRPVFAAHLARKRILALMKEAGALEAGSTANAVVIWIPDAGGELEKLPEYQQYFLRSLRYLLTREGVRLRVQEVKPGVAIEESLTRQVALHVSLLELPAELQKQLASVSTPVLGLDQAGQGLCVPVRGERDACAGDALSTPHAVDAVFTGVVPIVYKSQRKLLDGLIQSTVWSFLTITPLMMFVCRGILAGLVVMIPNALPVLMIFGGMGWLGWPVDIGSMMAASIALGVAVDDTIHYLTWYREALAAGHPRKTAIIRAYGHCASPTIQSALISGLGMSVFVFSTFMPTRRLGILMLAILIAGCLAELIMLPAILAGPMGKVFSATRRRTTSTPPSDSANAIPSGSVRELPYPLASASSIPATTEFQRVDLGEAVLVNGKPLRKSRRRGALR